MIEPHCHSLEWIEAQRQRLGAADAEILERAIFALTLLDALSRTGLDFVFKGGTALLLHLPQPLRLSIDIDIICETDRGELGSILDRIVAETPFERWEEQDRGADRLPRRLHFKLFYPSPVRGGEERPVLLDVVTERSTIEHLEAVPVTASFIETRDPAPVTMPTASALLGDKMTAFAPGTIGVPLNENYSLQVIKQLFDIGQLYDRADDLKSLAAANRASFEAECRYRNLNASYEDYLADVTGTCLRISSLDLRGFEETDQTRLLRRGVGQMPNYLMGTRFLIPQAKVAASKAAVLAAILGRAEMPAALPRFERAVLPRLKNVRLDPELAILEKLKSIGPEAYFYWALRATDALR